MRAEEEEPALGLEESFASLQTKPRNNSVGSHLVSAGSEDDHFKQVDSLLQKVRQESARSEFREELASIVRELALSTDQLV